MAVLFSRFFAVLALAVGALAPRLVSALPDQTATAVKSPAANPQVLPGDYGRVALLAATIAKELAVACPFADPADERALKTCKEKLYGDSALRSNLTSFVLWGRIRNPATTLKDSHLTQFGPNVFTSSYVPLFMFNGDYTVAFDERENLHRVELVTAFRNRLAPGQFPYPFWHDDNKWAIYQGANRITMWIGLEGGPGTERIKVMQFSTFGKDHAELPKAIAKPDFTKDHATWLWKDAKGHTQPVVTLFDNQYSASNPYLKPLDEAYRAVALEMRDGECLSCHVPDNPDKMKRLVLLQTPAHAADEISRVIASVQEGRMPLDEIGVEKAMPEPMKDALLRKARTFEQVIREARAWENAQRLITLKRTAK